VLRGFLFKNRLRKESSTADLPVAHWIHYSLLESVRALQMLMSNRRLITEQGFLGIVEQHQGSASFLPWELR
jgi:hypothetical protein